MQRQGFAFLVTLRNRLPQKRSRKTAKAKEVPGRMQKRKKGTASLMIELQSFIWSAFKTSSFHFGIVDKKI